MYFKAAKNTLLNTTSTLWIFPAALFHCRYAELLHFILHAYI